MESETVPEPTLHELDKRITSVEDWRRSEADERSTVRKQLSGRIDRHDTILNGSDDSGGLVSAVRLLTANQDELKRMTRWVIGAVFVAVFALIWTAATTGG